jgi:hypothetical protein
MEMVFYFIQNKHENHNNFNQLKLLALELLNLILTFEFAAKRFYLCDISNSNMLVII